MANLVGDVVKAAPAFVQLFSPGTMKLFGDAIDNVGAAIGSMLAPLFDMARGPINALNAQLTNIAPLLQKAFAAFAPVFNKATQIIEALQTTFETLAEMMSKSLEASVPIMLAIGDAIIKIIPLVGEFVSAIAMLGDEIRECFEGGGDAIKDFFEGFMGVIGKIVRGLTFVITIAAALIALLREGKSFTFDDLMNNALERYEAIWDHNRPENAKAKAQGKTYANRPATYQAIGEAGMKLQIAALSMAQSKVDWNQKNNDELKKIAANTTPKPGPAQVAAGGGIAVAGVVRPPPGFWMRAAGNP